MTEFANVHFFLNLAWRVTITVPSHVDTEFTMVSAGAGLDRCARTEPSHRPLPYCNRTGDALKYPAP
jgi:hypothetical protein